MSNANPKDVLEFWFGKVGEPGYLKAKSFWYGNEEDDKLVAEKLGSYYEEAKNGGLSNWADIPDGSIALIILLDQVPRNIFRNKAQAYATDNLALSVAKKMVENGWDKNQPTVVRRYVYSPFNHSENLEDQKRSLELFTDLGDPTHMYWARNFYETIKKYGRFPHRDEILGRSGN
ncbi:hypothetical protein PACTADRAFT_48362 [Pachysolen tannophilus NRRL Y-2460]|uniref:DUF924 domain-containing protein n=1 Tax=Pachysolen tannophilus NRRL Y-2460 TaxID=669874 RepID=A0A1E4TXM8_PACTA|nr:hypothetical protein PACTADRAFT_48362 [Pachysolen tannophilus NRRL Y-2460]